ncbi:MAG: endonuclease/exonuclease/phosphatase family protein [Actinocatenispora sp.]
MSVPRILTTMTAGLAALACSALALAAIPGAANASAHRPSVRHVRVMTFNIHHGAGADNILDLEDTARSIEAHHPDAIGLQEVDRHWDTRSDFLDEAQWLADRLHMHAVYGANLDEDPPADGQPRRQYGTAILSRYPILDWSNTHLTKAGHPESEQRGLLHARILVRGMPFNFYNTHLQHDSAAIRLAQVAQVKELIGTPRDPWILTGDLNAEPTAPEIVSLTEHLSDTWAEVGVGDGFTYDATKPHARIDYVLTGAGVTPRHAEVADSGASDHLPVVADLVLRGRHHGRH